MIDRRRHWDRVYAARAPDAVSWFQAEPTLSLALIEAAGLASDARVVDVGAGASQLVDRLLDRGFEDVTVIDVSRQAIEQSRARLEAARSVTWLVQDVTTWAPASTSYDLWHDRAVFHFLVEESDRRSYLAALCRAVRAGGFVIIGTFALSGPERCSELAVQRYSPEMLQAVVGAAFELVEARMETHTTPGSALQDFTWCLFRRR